MTKQEFNRVRLDAALLAASSHLRDVLVWLYSVGGRVQDENTVVKALTAMHDMRVQIDAEGLVVTEPVLPVPTKCDGSEAGMALSAIKMLKLFSAEEDLIHVRDASHAALIDVVNARLIQQHKAKPQPPRLPQVVEMGLPAETDTDLEAVQWSVARQAQ